MSMAKIIISADIHFCKRESLVDNRYDLLVKSFDWVNNLTKELTVGGVQPLNVDLGDMFNTSILTAEDIAVLDTIKFTSEWHCIAGNHEIDGSNSLLKYFRDLHVIYEKPQLKNFGKHGGWVLFLPFTKEPKSLDELLRKLPENEQVVVFSHCEFAGMFGAENGYTISEITNDKRIKMWFNGHYHTRAKLSPKIQIVGNLVGKNFTQNFDPHGVAVYDTDTNEFEFIENPYAIRFGKMDVSKEECKAIRKLIESDPIKRYALAIQCDIELKEQMKEWADKFLIASRIVVTGGVGASGFSEVDLEDSQPIAIDHIAMFKKEVGIRFGEDMANAIFKN